MSLNRALTHLHSGVRRTANITSICHRTIPLISRFHTSASSFVSSSNNVQADTAAAAAPSISQPTYPSASAAAASVSSPSSSSSSSPHRRQTKRAWHLFDARDQVVGRIASRIASLLSGKDKPNFTPNLDNGDVVVVLNARHVKLTGSKWENKLYRYHSGYAGGLKAIPASRWREQHPDRIIRHAVAGMIVKNKLKVPRLNRLKIYPGLVHPHSAQFPFDIIEQVPRLKQERDLELAQLAEEGKVKADAFAIASQGAKAKLQSAASGESKKGSSGVEVEQCSDDTLPQDPDIKKAIIKDREQRKGRPVVLL